jgi:hypothetical protein
VRIGEGGVTWEIVSLSREFHQARGRISTERTDVDRHVLEDMSRNVYISSRSTASHSATPGKRTPLNCFE